MPKPADPLREQLLHLAARAEKGLKPSEVNKLIRGITTLCDVKGSQAGEIEHYKRRLAEAQGAAPASDPLTRALADKLPDLNHAEITRRYTIR